MMKRELKVGFTDFWPGFKASDNLFVNLLRNDFDVNVSEDPDILIYSVYDFNHLKYNCAKIFYTAENVRPNFNECDFAISFDYETYGGKNLRMPLYRWRGDLESLCKEKDTENIILEKKKFACMVVSNGACSLRNRFFKLLSEYKQVDSGGKYMNNVGGTVADKINFIKDYKFVLSFENSSYPGYTTEKIVEPMLMNSLPVYWGNPKIAHDFNPSSFINVHEYDNLESVIGEIVKIDKDESLYRNYVEAPFFDRNRFPETLRFEYFEKRIVEMIDALLKKKPISSTKFYRPIAIANKLKKKMLSRIYGKPHFYF